MIDGFRPVAAQQFHRQTPRLQGGNCFRRTGPQSVTQLEPGQQSLVLAEALRLISQQECRALFES